MTNSNKEWIENLEANVEEIKEEIQKMNVDVADKFKSIEEALKNLAESMKAGRDGGDASATHSTVRSTERHQQIQAAQTEIVKPLAAGRTVKLELPRFKEGDPTAWISKATSKAPREDAIEITWPVFEGELWVRFGPAEGEEFDEALSKIQQTGTLQEYQRELHDVVERWEDRATTLEHEDDDGEET